MNDTMPLSSLQREMWIAEKKTASARENVYAAVRLRGRIDVPSFVQAFRTVVERHEPLRMWMPDLDLPATRVAGTAAELDVQDCASEAEAVRICAEDAEQRLELDSLPLWKARLFRVAEEEHVFGFVFHHFVIDGWSLYVLLSDIAAVYNGLIDGAGSPLPSLGATYSDYCAEDLAGRQAGRHDLAVQHWRKQLPAELPVLEMPSDAPRETSSGVAGSSIRVSLGDELSTAMDDLARRSRCTTFQVVLAATAQATGELADTSQVIFGVPFHNRVARRYRTQIGYFSNVLPFAMDLTRAAGSGFQDVLELARSCSAAALKYPGVPPEELMREIYGRDGLPYRFCLNVQPPPPITFEFTGLAWESIPMHNGTTNFDYELTLGRNDSVVGGSLTFDSDIYRDRRAHDLWNLIAKTIESAV